MVCSVLYMLCSPLCIRTALGDVHKMSACYLFLTETLQLDSNRLDATTLRRIFLQCKVKLVLLKFGQVKISTGNIAHFLIVCSFDAVSE